MEDCKEADILSVTTTVGSRTDAEVLAQALVDRRLAACVQVEEGVQSFYRWDGQLRQEAEVRLVIKTLPACEAAVQELFAELHPYEVPQFLAVPMRASPAYFDWVLGEVELTKEAPARTPAR